MSGPFSSGVTALDEALIAEPVFKSEVGLSHRRVKLERAFAKAARAWVENAVEERFIDRAIADVLLADLPEVAEGSIKVSKY
jgi:hypothetical protein